MEIKELDSKVYKGKTYHFKYVTPEYYDLHIEDMTFSFVYKEYEKPRENGFSDDLLGDWLEHPVLYGAFVNGELAGIVEGCLENWNNRFRISNILVFEDYRKHQVGTNLIQHMFKVAKEMAARMVVLETQSCNIPAIHFYMKNGLKIIGFDTHSYSNHDMEKGEVRIEMGMEL